jgi:hypothetical protein
MNFADIKLAVIWPIAADLSSRQCTAETRRVSAAERLSRLEVDETSELARTYARSAALSPIGMRPV